MQLIAVSKKQPVSALRDYIIAARSRGIEPSLGENYMQELKSKRSQIGADATFHVIGPLQSNKVRDAVKYGDVIESVHSLAILRTVAQEARKQGKQQPIFLQVNISDDSAKSGFPESEVESVLQQASQQSDALRIDGLMTITALYDDPKAARADFRRMSALRTSLIKAGCSPLFNQARILLSMGMSADYSVAIEEGADLVRVGTALFGEREA